MQTFTVFVYNPGDTCHAKIVPIKFNI